MEFRNFAWLRTRVVELEQRAETAERELAEARANAERDAVAFTDLKSAFEQASKERDEARASHEALARIVGQALVVPTLRDGEEFAEPSDHAIVSLVMRLVKERDEARAALRDSEVAHQVANADEADYRDALEVAEAEVARLRREAEVSTISVAVAVAVVNGHLDISAACTHRGDELKCWTPDDEGGRSQTYLDAKDCAELAEAFEAIGAALKEGRDG
jgi:hypothetical protein